MKSYVFKVVIEPDEEKWHARVPELESKGAATWGETRDEAFRNIQEVARMVIEDMLEDGEPIPEGAIVYNEPVVAVTV
jgi:predicted RNase H-like HicB family nuclease